MLPIPLGCCPPNGPIQRTHMLPEGSPPDLPICTQAWMILPYKGWSVSSYARNLLE
ncbi:uncharacterized protein EI90DRAFT_3029135 [Cantharellus anzutake]|uniref:uncharacterized protein n=1 Tax=Cantharellus anzutake TaxID=1750568 RepID=UPI00190827E5|nr:uncharacterized protein EI90DRAFT_3029135 [Cantharellus anzutake]KAF8344299.1 hypothetical protein EI90DRAFT_3029135 [Cantharellus anzutake]